MTSSSTERAAALAALLIGSDAGGEAGAAPQLERTGREVEAGGNIARLLVRDAFTLGYRLPDGSYQRAEAQVGDVVLLSRGEADRLDALGVTVDPDTDLDTVEEQQADGVPTDEELKAKRAEDLVAYVAQHPEERERVRALEETRSPSQQRSSVLKATEPTPVEDDEAARAAAAAQADAGDGTDQGTSEDDATATAEAQQGNDGGSGE